MSSITGIWVKSTALAQRRCLTDAAITSCLSFHLQTKFPCYLAQRRSRVLRWFCFVFFMGCCQGVLFLGDSVEHGLHREFEWPRSPLGGPLCSYRSLGVTHHTLCRGIAFPRTALAPSASRKPLLTLRHCNTATLQLALYQGCAVAQQPGPRWRGNTDKHYATEGKRLVLPDMICCYKWPLESKHFHNTITMPTLPTDTRVHTNTADHLQYPAPQHDLTHCLVFFFKYC